MIEDLKKNINTEMEILKEISVNFNRLSIADISEQQLLMSAIDALIASMRIVNNSIPSLLDEISLAKRLPSSKEIARKSRLEKVIYQGTGKELNVTINRRDKARLLKELDIGEGYIKKLKKRQRKFKEEYVEFKAARGYMRLANRFFLEKSVKLVNKGYFKKLSIELRKANIDVLFPAYLAMSFMTIILALIIGFFLMVFLLFFNIGIDFPFVTVFNGDYMIRALKVFWIPFAAPIITFIALYFYPTTEKQTLAKKINQELPFAVIHMSAISGSGIQPSEIFRIIGLSKEYPYLRKEIRKVLNQINLYGYDLVTALNNAASTSSSTKLAELFFGLATTINSGGEFSDFFNKRSETLLTDYRIEREKYAKTAETFMDIYISIVIAAPMILMLFLILLSLGNFSIGLSTIEMTFLIIGIIVVVNIFFILFIDLNQPSY